MRPAEKIKSLFKNSKIAVSPEVNNRLLNDTLTAFKKSKSAEPAKPRPTAWRIVMKSSVLKIAAIITVVGMLAIFFANTQRSLYAQVMKSFDRAKSVHAVGYRFRDGQMQRSGELWYLRGVGYRQTSIWKGKTEVRLDNGEYQWKYMEGNDFAIQIKSDGRLQLPREIQEPARYLEKCQRLPQEDQIIDSFQCQCYVSSDSADPGGKFKSMVWIDDQMRFRKYEEMDLREDGWATNEIVIVSYDIEIDAGLFEPDFGFNVEIIKPGDVLDQEFALEDAVATRDCLGVTVAVHDIKRHGEYLFITSSIRPTQATREQLSNYESRAYGSGMGSRFCDLWLSTWWTESEDGRIYHNYARDLLGTFKVDGITVYWHAILPKGQWPGMNEEWNFCGYLYTRDNLQQMHKEEGREWYKQFMPFFTLKLNAEETEVAEIANHIYQTAVLARPGRNRRTEFRPNVDRVTRDEYTAKVEKILAGLRPLKELWDEVGSQITLEVVDPNGTPVSGAELALGMPGNHLKCLVTDENGKTVVRGEHMFTPLSSRNSWSSIYAVYPQRQLAALAEITDAHFGKTLTVEIQPACKVSARFVSPDWRAQGKQLGWVDSSISYDGEPKSGTAHRLDVIRLRDEEQFHALLVPGRYEISCQSINKAEGWTAEGSIGFEIPEGQAELDLGEIELKLRER